MLVYNDHTIAAYIASYSAKICTLHIFLHIMAFPNLRMLKRDICFNCVIEVNLLTYFLSLFRATKTGSF